MKSMLKPMARITALLMAMCLCLPAAILYPFADGAEWQVIFEESFDDYEPDVGGEQTKLSDTFVVEANSIGEGFVSVREDDTGNLFLQNHVFTQVYLKTPMTSTYRFEIDVGHMNGERTTGIFVRAPQYNAAYYEGDGGYEYDENGKAVERFGASTAWSGLVLYCNGGTLGVNVKSYDSKVPTDRHILNNTVFFDLPDGVVFGGGDYHTLSVEDDFRTIRISVDGTLICYVECGNTNQRKHSDLGITVKCLKDATLYDANGNGVMTVSDTLMSAAESICGWATRASSMKTDNVVLSVLSVETGPEETAKPDDATEPEDVTAAPAESEADTNAPAAESADAGDVTGTDVPSDAPETQGTPDEKSRQDTAPASEPGTTGGTDPVGETAVIDDSLAVYILIAVMLVAVGVTAGIIVAAKRRNAD